MCEKQQPVSLPVLKSPVSTAEPSTHYGQFYLTVAFCSSLFLITACCLTGQLLRAHLHERPQRVRLITTTFLKPSRQMALIEGKDSEEVIGYPIASIFQSPNVHPSEDLLTSRMPKEILFPWNLWFPGASTPEKTTSKTQGMGNPHIYTQCRVNDKLRRIFLITQCG